MPQELNLILTPKQASDKQYYLPIIAKTLNVDPHNIAFVRVVRRSIDARGKAVKVNMGVQVYVDEVIPETFSYKFDYPDVSHKDEVVIVGSGPAGLFAALRLIELGFKPIVLERGNDVSNRKRDVAQLNRNQPINVDSNYSFGEGGAGTFSDGKLYTRSKKRGDYRKALETLCFHGADENILEDAHPHIGTNVLPRIIANIRNTILNAGGQVHFGVRVNDVIVKDGTIKGVKTAGGETVLGKAVILATGHSARDIYELLHRKGILLEPKSFAMGVRVEHQQELIDSIQYHMPARGEYLPAAAYSIVQQVAGRGVYSFCMCPGGFIVPAATNRNEVVVNGMSPSLRNSKFANSGIVVEIRVEDFAEYAQYGPLAGLQMQMDLEKMAFEKGGNGVVSPAQRLSDFVQGKTSSELVKTSYHPGVTSSDMHKWLPWGIGQRLQEGFKAFDNKMKGFVTSEALILGVESRTSSPVRIPRDPSTLQHPQISGLFPCAEGAGYAGGIVSAAIDGERVAEAFVTWAK
ncbi:NAD(P)/FAD-dependent oxidoreductase [Alistipes sp. ZOR0009]|uniref:NAD(P)/FAD-dependent oxidoreductase n=1 Tax=Alistipes sp. ZOR0009 TaxID=1339253 RepID=UPI0006485DD9|nr:FAD-dependent oxidoreductase [Alistipes sp. ZOR0009]